MTVSEQSLLALDPALERALRDRKVLAMSPRQRVDHLLTVLFGTERRAFAYRAGHSTTAADTWRERRGDCLSLTILAYAAARALALDARIQEVRVPARYDRAGRIDYVNRHVNLLVRIPNRIPDEGRMEWREVVIDFEPQTGAVDHGEPLAVAAVLARFHNNLAVQALAAGQLARARVLLDAAMAADPGYSSSYTNLAAVLHRAGELEGAESRLRQAVALSSEPGVALHALHDLYLEQGRTADAGRVAERLQALRAGDPYYWLAQGLEHLRVGQPRQAVNALEHAQGLSSGFAQVHRGLAVAYWQLGEAGRARVQLDLLARLDEGDAQLAPLRRKIGDAARP